MGNYDRALKKAYDTHKPLLVLVVAKDSPYSNTVIKNVLMNQKYVETINEKMVAVIVTYGGNENYPIEMYYTTVFPTLFFVDAQRELFLEKPLYGDEINRKNVEKSVKKQK
jgi:thioredoxin-related protein